MYCSFVEVAMYLPDNLKWKRRTDLETEEIECIWVEGECLLYIGYLLVAFIDPLTLLATCEKPLTKILTKC